MSLAEFFPRTKTLNAMTNRGLSLNRIVDLWRSRQALSRLDARALEDIGIDASAADREAQKPVWDVPSNWRD